MKIVIFEPHPDDLLFGPGPILLDWMKEAVSNQTMKGILSYLGFMQHIDNFAKGLIDTVDIVYFLSIIIVCLFLTIRSLEAKRYWG